MVALSKQQQFDSPFPSPLTYRDWLEMPEDDRRLELWNGVLIVSPSPSDRHQHIQAQFGTEVVLAARQTRNARVYYDYDVRISDHTVLRPDVVVFTGAAGGMRTAQSIVGPPDLVVEIVSPSSRGRDFIQKSAFYAEVGVPEYWLIDPDAQQLIIGRLHDGQYEREIVTEGPVRCEALGGAMIDISAIAMTEEEDS